MALAIQLTLFSFCGLVLTGTWPPDDLEGFAKHAAVLGPILGLNASHRWQLHKRRGSAMITGAFQIYARLRTEPERAADANPHLLRSRLKLLKRRRGLAKTLSLIDQLVFPVYRLPGVGKAYLYEIGRSAARPVFPDCPPEIVWAIVKCRPHYAEWLSLLANAGASGAAYASIVFATP